LRTARPSCARSGNSAVESSQAALLWHNPKNPCTDIWHWLGTLEPGEERVSCGRLYFKPARRAFDELLARFRTDAWPETRRM